MRSARRSLAIANGPNRDVATGHGAIPKGKVVGKKATLDGDGRTFDEIAVERNKEPA
jgi:hypothetical protein